MKKHPILRYLFIASLTAIIFQSVSMVINLTKDPKETLLEQAEKLRDIKPDAANQLEKFAYEQESNKYFRIMPYINIFFILISLVAVVLMWQLNKTGWYLYLFSEFAPYIITVVSWENYVKYYTGLGNTAILATTFAMLAFDILFAGLYFYALRETEKLNTSSENVHSESTDNQVG